jgi:hypothetical protein
VCVCIHDHKIKQEVCDLKIKLELEIDTSSAADEQLIEELIELLETYKNATNHKD